MKQALGVLLLAALMVGCASTPKSPRGVVHGNYGHERGQGGRKGSVVVSELRQVAACEQTREHRDEDYTPGGLYAPGVRDSAPEAPLDISGLVEPEPRDEPPSAYGNRSPYTVLGQSYRVRDTARGYRERGVASWYGQKFHGRLTSSREPYDMCSFSAAHKTLPLPSYARVTNLDNGHSVVVRVNDRGPFHEGRIIDLSYAAAIKLGVDRTGTARVEVEALTADNTRTARAVSPPPQPLPRQVPRQAPMPVSTPVAPPMQAMATPSSPVEQSPAGSQRVVQVASFGEQANAHRAVERLRAAGITGVGLEPVERDGRTLWRVRVAPVLADAAPGLIEQLARLGFPGSRLFSQ